MGKAMGWAVATGLVLALATGCGSPTQKSVNAKLQSQIQTLSEKNYKSTATMTVQMDNGVQTYYIETWYDGPDVYLIKLGDDEKNINQVIVKNKTGMFIVSPSLQKVFRFNGNWAQNQGHIYLYDQILQQIVSGGKVSMKHTGDAWTFDMPVTPKNDVVSRERVTIDPKTLNPRQVILYDEENKAMVTIKFTEFKTGVRFNESDFNPQKIAASGTKQAMAEISDSDFGYVRPDITGLGDRLDGLIDTKNQDTVILRYGGPHAFTLTEQRPTTGDSGLADAQLVDLFGVPALYDGSGASKRLIWLHDGVQFGLASQDLSLAQMEQLAISTFDQVGK
ncbi:MAG: outer membrane lipoprotein carrier protein LolA [Alicyclobacillus herbarius]|uniref:LolA family protein n=1 Tax=Alicyclobacillus herbarius TaxID=122960 RepID=UPI00040FBC4C|nr:outer membrane lipoprotein carrier protein LolA [Alicyclobacillus herbarius]MCL6632619.1 outer membrane lipoprotein carrier protein LolA [Alicyclobacillus herbarius]